MSYPVVGMDIKFTFSLGVDITGAKTKQVGCIKPDGTLATAIYLTATIITDATGVGYADLTNVQNDTAGVWRVFPWIVQSDDKVVGAPAIEFTVIEKGEAGV